MKLPFSIDLAGKTTVVTGGGGVLCMEFCRAVAGCGAKVAVVDLDLDAARAVTEPITAAGQVARPYQGDVLDRDNLEEVRGRIATDLGPCSILINGAGGNAPAATTTKEYYVPGDIDVAETTSFFDLDPKNVAGVFNLNVLGTITASQVFAKDMVDRPGCSIVNISSMNAYTPLTKIPAYSGAKAAVSNFTQWLAVHFSKVGIRVNAIAPGFFVTRQNLAMLYEGNGAPTPRTGKILAATPLGRFGQPEELVGTLLFLLSDEAAGFVTGVVVPVDGGYSAYSGV